MALGWVPGSLATWWDGLFTTSWHLGLGAAKKTASEALDGEVSWSPRP